MDSLKMQEQYSFLNEGFTETMGTEKYFQWMIHWNIGHWNLFSVNSFAENKVKIVDAIYTLPECKWGAHLPALGHSACSEYMADPVTLGWCKARPTVTFPAQSTATVHWPVVISIRNEAGG